MQTCSLEQDSRYVALRRIVATAEKKTGQPFDFAIIDLPPSFGALVRASFYSSDYYIVPCTSDNFSVYCIGLIGQMVPSFVQDWHSGLQRFRATNPHYTDFDNLGRPVFAGWVFNGFDTTRRRRTAAEVAADAPMGPRQMVQADQTMHERVSQAISQDLIGKLHSQITGFHAVANIPRRDSRIGDVEDANVLIQNSLWLNVPLSQLGNHQQVVSLQDRRQWAWNQQEQITLLAQKFDELAANVESVCT